MAFSVNYFIFALGTVLFLETEGFEAYTPSVFDFNFTFVLGDFDVVAFGIDALGLCVGFLVWEYPQKIDKRKAVIKMFFIISFVFN